MSQKEQQLVTRIVESPYDDEPALAYATYVQKRDPELAEMIRLDLKLRRQKHGDPGYDEESRHRMQLKSKVQPRLTRGLGPLIGEYDDVNIESGLVSAIFVRSLTDARLERLKHVPFLRYLFINGGEISEAGMKAICQLRYLTIVSLQKVKVTPQAIPILATLPPGTVVHVYGEGIDMKAVDRAAAERLSVMDKLSPQEQTAAASQYIRYFEHGWREPGPPKVAPFSQAGITDAEMRLLAALPELETVVVTVSDITSKGLSYLSGMKHLKQLELWDTKVESLVPITDCIALQVLNVFPEYGTTMGDAGTAGLEKLVNLTEVYLNDDAISDATIKRFATLTKLKKLDLSAIELKEETSLAALANLKAMEHLTLNAGTFSDQALQYLAPMTELKFLYVKVRTGKGEGFAHLANLQKLEELYIHGDGVTDDCIPHLAALKNLRVVMAQGSAITEAGAQKLVAGFPRLTVILDDHVVKSARESYVFKRKNLNNVASMLLPVDWTDKGEDDSISLTEDGWENIGSYGGDQVGPANIRLYLHEDSFSSVESVMKDYLRDELPATERDTFSLNGAEQAASCVFKTDFAQTLLCVGKIGSRVAVLTCQVRAPRFASMRPLFNYIARSVRLGGDASRHADERTEVRVADLK
ncbi:MAG: hypothetical protein WD768_19475 [Phycisphaeraceae bacterium]